VERDAYQAAHYLLGLESSMKLQAQHPRVGRSIDDIREGYFKFPSASHLLIYRPMPDVIAFIRVLHRAMDVEWHF
jgi:toxin ParE1/3/4